MTPRILKKSLLFIIAIILVLGLSVSFQSLLAAWTAPAANPPTCATGNPGCDAPLNAGPLIQPKSGALWLNTNGLSPYGLIVETGNVGIGTVSPGAKLEVAGQVKITGGTPGANKVLTSDANGLASWQTPASFSEADTLQTVTTRGNTTSLGLVVNGQTINHQTNNFFYVNSYDGLQLRINSDGAGASNFQINNSANSSVLTVTNAGNVGIGTASPGAKLNVEGDGATIIVTDGGSTRVSLGDNGAAGGYIQLMNSAGTLKTYLRNDGGGSYFNAGNVGIGTASPGYKLHVNGSFAAQYKNFEIPHPLDPENKLLVHSSVEGPEHAVYYRGEAQLVDSEAIIVLPDYFEALTRIEARTVQLTCLDGYSPLYVDGPVKDAKFVVRTVDIGNPLQRFYWELKAVRADIPLLKAERQR